VSCSNLTYSFLTKYLEKSSVSDTGQKLTAQNPEGGLQKKKKIPLSLKMLYSGAKKQNLEETASLLTAENLLSLGNTSLFYSKSCVYHSTEN
jgi:hypothetical protein